KKKGKEVDVPVVEEANRRRMRADGRRKLSLVLEAAAEVFAMAGVKASVREIAARAGVGLGTVYRHFPRRSDLIAAVMQSKIDACADAAATLASKYEPGEALVRWLHRFMDLLGTKRGVAAALHSGDPAYQALPGYFLQRVGPALETLLKEAVAAKVIQPGMNAESLLWTVATICNGPHGVEPTYARTMVNLLVDGMRYGTKVDSKA
ncbi:MAG: TetR/AcrR family transcriptional regulator, partial [Terriglobales bacterium]